MVQLFDFINYKSYLKKCFSERGKTQKGVRSRFAEAVGCRSGYVTQVLEGSADLSLEQADSASQFLGHTNDEAEYFLLLVIYGRAGTKRLKNNIEKQIRNKQDLHQNLKDRFKVSAISEESQMVFYSSWQYLAVLSLLSVPNLQTKEALSLSLDIPLKRISEIIEFLEGAGLILLKGDKYLPTTKRTHLGKDSPMLPKHHINWRLQAIQSIEQNRITDLHYSSVIGLSEHDAKIVKERLIQALEDIGRIIEPSPEEAVCSLCIDFFDILKKS